MARPDSKRALRRHHRARLIRARLRQWAWGGSARDAEPWYAVAGHGVLRGKLTWAPSSSWCSCGLCAALSAAGVTSRRTGGRNDRHERMVASAGRARASLLEER